MIGDYIVHCVLRDDRETALADGFRLPEAEFQALIASPPPSTEVSR